MSDFEKKLTSKLADIKCFINDVYDDEKDKTGLTKNQEESKKVFNIYCDDLKQAIQELDKFKALLNKYEIKDIETLEELINDYDDMAKSLIQYALGIEVEVKS